MSQEPESSAAVDESQQRDKSFRQGYCWLRPSLLTTPFRMIMDCISVDPPRVDSPDMLNAALRSDEAHRENDSMRLGSHYNGGAHDNLAKHKNYKDPVSETSLLLQHREDCQVQTNYTQLNHPGSKDINRATVEAEAYPIEIHQSPETKNHQSIPKSNSQATQTQSSFHSASIRSSNVSSGIADCCLHYLSEESESDSDCAIESYETPPTDRSHGTGTKRGSGQTQEAETESPGTPAKPTAAMPISYAKSPVKAKQGTSLLSLSLSQEQQQKQKKLAKAATRSSPVRAYAHKLSTRRQSSQHVRFVSGPSKEELVDRRVTAQLQEEGRKGAVKVYTDATVDSAEVTEFIIDWIEKHRHYWI